MLDQIGKPLSASLSGMDQRLRQKPLLFGHQTPKDSFQLRFAGKMDVERPATIEGSTWANDFIQVDPADLAKALVVRLDEVMTTTGEAYAVTPERKGENKRSEAFTTLIDVDFRPAAQRDYITSGKMDISTMAQVHSTYKANMGVYGEAKDFYTGDILATARANFMAVDAESFADPERRPELPDVTPVGTDGPMDEAKNKTMASWSKGLLDFYTPMIKRLGSSKVTHANVSELRSPVRLINDNDYVTVDQLNKKHSGHGGVTAGMAMAQMRALATRYLDQNGVSHTGVQVDGMTANFLKPYFETDSLQFDTTIDHIDQQGNMFMSTRVSRHDTQGGEVHGPVFMINAVLTHKPPARSIIGQWVSSAIHRKGPIPNMDQHIHDEEGFTRQAEAKQWAALRNMPGY